MFGLSGATIKLIVIGLAIAAVVAYIGFLKLEVNHYRTDRDNIQAQYSLVIHTQAAKLAAVQTQVAEQDKERQAFIAQTNENVKALLTQQQKEIAKHAEELRACKLSGDAARVFDHPTSSVSGPNQADSTGKTDTGNDAGTPAVGDSITGEDIAQADAINYKNFELIRSYLIQFQKLAKQNEENLNGAP